MIDSGTSTQTAETTANGASAAQATPAPAIVAQVWARSVLSRPAPSDPATIPAIQAAIAIPYQTPPAWSVPRIRKTSTTSTIPTSRTTSPRPTVSGASTGSLRRISKPPRGRPERASASSPAGRRRVRTSAAAGQHREGGRVDGQGQSGPERTGEQAANRGGADENEGIQ